MSRNVVVSFAEGYRDVLDDKNRGLYDFLQPIWGGGGLYSRGYTRDFTVAYVKLMDGVPNIGASATLKDNVSVYVVSVGHVKSFGTRTGLEVFVLHFPKINSNGSKTGGSGLSVTTEGRKFSIGTVQYIFSIKD